MDDRKEKNKKLVINNQIETMESYYFTNELIELMGIEYDRKYSVEELVQKIDEKYRRQSGKYLFKENKKLYKQLCKSVSIQLVFEDCICYPIEQKTETRPEITHEIVENFVRQHVMKNGKVKVSEMLKRIIDIDDRMNYDFDDVVNMVIGYIVDNEMMISPMYGVFEPTSVMREVMRMNGDTVYDIFSMKKHLKSHITLLK